MPPVPAEQNSPYGLGGIVDEPARISRFGFDPVVSLREAAAIIGCHPDTLKNQARRGKLTILRISERRLGIRGSELNRYLATCEAAA